MCSPSVAFFGKPGLLSSRIRGEQIAERLGVSYNKLLVGNDHPKHLVFVKGYPEKMKGLLDEFTIWLDPVDTDSYLHLIPEHQSVKVLSTSSTATDYLKARLANDVVEIPQQHCNFYRAQTHHFYIGRPVVGYVGYAENLHLDVEFLRGALDERGLDFICLFVNAQTTREEVVDFYKSIDIQITFRKPHLTPGMPPEMKSPLKVVNAASFGVPTIGTDEISTRHAPMSERVSGVTELIHMCSHYAQNHIFEKTDLLQYAEQFHIDNVVEQYKKLFF